MATRSKKQRRLLSLIITVGLLVLFALLFSLFSSYSQLRDLQRERDETAQELSQMQTENQKMAEQVQESDTDAYVIRMARRLLGWVFPDDIRVIESEE